MNKIILKGKLGLCQQPKCVRKAIHKLCDADNPDFTLHLCEEHFKQTTELITKLSNIFESDDNTSGLPLEYLISHTKDKKENE